MLTWNERLGLELRNRGNDDVRLLLEEIDRLTQLLEGNHVAVEEKE